MANHLFNHAAHSGGIVKFLPGICRYFIRQGQRLAITHHQHETIHCLGGAKRHGLIILATDQDPLSDAGSCQARYAIKLRLHICKGMSPQICRRLNFVTVVALLIVRRHFAVFNDQ
ncbi:hypothetical protein DSECCO2_448230 [anaerobic digester metagenome]